MGCANAGTQPCGHGLMHVHALPCGHELMHAHARPCAPMRYSQVDEVHRLEPRHDDLGQRRGGAHLRVNKEAWRC